MPLQSEYNLLRRLIGDFKKESFSDSDLIVFLNDAARERSLQTEALEVTNVFDDLPDQFKPEAVYQAAINWWWNRAGELADKHSQTVGQASQDVGEKWDRAMRMIENLTTSLNAILNDSSHSLPIMENLSRFSKTTLTRLGGQSEEDALEL